MDRLSLARDRLSLAAGLQMRLTRNGIKLVAGLGIG